MNQKDQSSQDGPEEQLKMLSHNDGDTGLDSELSVVASPSPGGTSSAISINQADSLMPPKRGHRPLLIGVSVIGAVLLIGAVAVSSKFFSKPSTNSSAAAALANSNVASRFKTTNPPKGISSLAANQLSNAQSVLTINGQARVANGVVLSPSSQPSAPQTGELYYNQTINQPYYYNGTTFVSLTQPSIGGMTGNIVIGSGLQASNNQLRATGVLQLLGTADQINTSAGTGNVTLSLPQSISTNSTPTFAGLTLDGPLAVGSGGTGATTPAGARSVLGAATNGANNDITSTTELNTITPNGPLTIGAANQPLILQGNGSSQVTSSSGGFTTTLAFAPPIADVQLLVPAFSAGSYDICTTSGNCTGGGSGIGGGGTANTLAMFTNGITIGDSLVTQSASTVTVGGSLNAATAILLNGSDINIAGTLNNVAYLNKANTFTNTNVIEPASNSATAFQVQNATAAAVLDVDTTNRRIGINTNAPNADLSFGVGDRTIDILNQSAINTNGNTLTVTGGGGNGTGAGGAVTIKGASGTPTSGSNGGPVNITGGTGSGAGGDGGAVTITGGSAGVTAGHNGGNVTLSAGLKSASGTSGSTIVKNGDNSTAAFQIQNTSGAALLNYDTVNQQLSVQSLNDAAVAGAEIFTNSESLGAAAGWGSISGTGASATATHTNGGGTTSIAASPGLTVTTGTVYRVTFTVSGLTAGSLNSSIGGVGSNIAVTTNTTETDYITAINNGNLSFSPSNTFDGVLSGISVVPMSNQTPSLVVKDSTGATAAEVRVSTNAVGNLAIGINALQSASGFSPTSGEFNTAFGNSALQNNTSGVNNSAFGYQALQKNATGVSNTAFGTQALQNNTTFQNTGVGYQTLQFTTTGTSNTGVGVRVLQTNTTGSASTGVGYAALQVSTASDETAFGFSSLRATTSGAGNTAVGFQSGYQDSTQTDFQTLKTISNSTLFGQNSQATCSNCMVLGGQGANAVTSVGIGTPNPTNFFSAEPLQYNTGTVATTSGSGALVGTGTTFTAAMVGSEIYIASNSTTTATYKGTVSAFTDATHITVTPNENLTLAGAHYYILYTGFQIGGTGNVGIGTLSPNVNYALDVLGDINTSTQYRVGGTVVCTATGCTPASGSGNYIQNQNTGQQPTSNFWISGTGRADTSVLTLTVDTATGAALNIGNTNATSVAIGNTTNNIATTVNGTAIVKPTSGHDSATAFQVQNAAGAAILTDDTLNNRLSAGLSNTNATQNFNVYGTSLLQQDTAAPTITVAGTEITDATRTTNTSGDGRPVPDSSYGVWEATTNLTKNGGFESNTTNNFGAGSGITTLTRDTSTAKFGTASVKVVPDGTGNGQGVALGDNAGTGSHIPVSASTTYTASAWVKGTNGTEALFIGISWYDSGGTIISTSSTNFTSSTTWTRYTETAASPSNAAGALVRIANQNNLVIDTFWVDGVQLEQKGYATPYVETNGATATRNAAAPSLNMTNYFSPNQGWVAMRVRMGTTPGNRSGQGANSPRFFSACSGCGTTDAQMFFSSSYDGKIGVDRRVSGTTDSAGSAVAWSNPGDYVTVIGYFTPASVGISANGSNFTTAAGSNIPAGLTTYGIGNQSGGTSTALDSDILWMATGLGTLTNADAAAINNFGNADPDLTSFNAIDSSSLPKMVWKGNSANFQDKLVLSVQNSTNTAVLNIGTADNSVLLPNATSYSSGLIFGGDASIYRSAAQTLQTNSGLTIAPSTDSITLFQVKNSAGGTLLGADTVNNRVGIGTAAPGAKLDIQTASNIGLTVNQVGLSNIMQLQNNGTNVATVSNTGAAVFENSANSTTAFQVQNAAGTTGLNYDTTNQQLSVRNLNDAAVAGAEMFTNSESFPATAGWTAISGTGASATATHTNGGGVTALSPTPALSVTAGTVYKVVYTISGMTQGSTNVNIGNGGVIANANGTRTDYITSGSTANLTFTPTNTFDGTVNNISVMPMSSQTPSLVVKDSTGATAAELRVSTSANGNLGLGINALSIASDFSSTSGEFNTAFGNSALQGDASGYENTSVGYQSLKANTFGQGNSAVGYQALLSNTFGNLNVAVGDAALKANVGGTANTALGYAALINSTGSDNTATGENALRSVGSGNFNTGYGYRAGNQDANQLDFETLSTISGTTILGANAQATCSNCMVLGGQGADSLTGGVGIGTPNPTNFLSAEPLEYNTGTVATTASSGAVVGTGTTFTAAMVGSEIYIASNSTGTATYKGTVQTFTDATHITVTPNETQTLAAADYYILYTGLQVKSDGTVYTGGGSATQFQVQNAAGTTFLNADATNQQLSVRNLNDAAVPGAEMFTNSESFPATAGWTAISGTGASATATHTNGGGVTALSPTPALTILAANAYKVTYTVTGMTGGTVRSSIGGVSASVTVSSNTTETDYIVTTNTSNLAFTPTTTFDGTVSNVSVSLMSNQTPALVVKDSTGAVAAELRVGSAAGGTNIGLGLNALPINSGTNNVAIGINALKVTSLRSFEVAVGANALKNETSGWGNVAVGNAALTLDTSGGNNTSIGADALDTITSGSNDSAIGYYAGHLGTQTDFTTLRNIASATLVGTYAQATCSSCMILGGQGADAVNVGIGTPNPTNFISAEPLEYNTGTVATTNASGAVVGTGTTFTAGMVGSEIYIASNTSTTAIYKGTVSAFTDATHITVTPNENLTLASAHYYILYTGFQVKSDGTVYTGGSSASQFQVQNAAGTAIVNVDTTNQQLSVQGLNDAAVAGAEMFTNAESFPATGGWTSISGTGASATATHTNGGGATALSPTPALTVNASTVYKVVYTVSGMTGGTIVSSIGGVSAYATVSTNTTETDYITTTGTGNLAFTPSNTFDGTVTSVSVMPMSNQTPSLVVKDSTGATAAELRVGTSAMGNLALGLNALPTASGLSATSGEFNTAFGTNAMQKATGAWEGAAFGYQALANDINSYGDAAFGYQAAMNLTGTYSTAVGTRALFSDTSGSHNTALGYSTLQNVTTGSGNVAVGYSAGYEALQPDFQTLKTINNATLLGVDTQATCSNCVILGGQGTDADKVGIGTPNPTNFLSAQPVEYNTGTVATTSGSGAVVGTGTTFTAAMVGSEIYIASNSSTTATYKGTVQTFTDATHITVTPNEGQTLAAADYYILYTGLQVKSDGTVYTGGGSTSQFSVQNAAGTSLLNYDTTNQQLSVRNLNDAAVAGSDMFSFTGSTESLPSVGNWTGSGTGSGATAAHTNGDGTAVQASPALSITAGNVYKVTYTTTSVTGGSVIAQIGGVSGASVSTNTTQTDYITATGVGNLLFVPSTTFVGTVGSVSVMLMSNQTPSLVVKDSSGATAAELRVSTSTVGNLALGINALPISSGLNSTNGEFNTAIGNSALQNNTSGYNNSAVGYQALQGNTTGTFNTAFGYQSQKLTSTGTLNTAIGDLSLDANTTGTGNTAVGYAALHTNAAGGSNTSVGYLSGYFFTGSGNTALGQRAGNNSQSDFIQLNGTTNATAIGESAVTACSSCLILGGQGADAVTGVGIGTPNPTNFISAEPLEYNTGTVATTNASGAVVGTGTTFTAAMVGSEIYIASNTPATATYKGTVQTFTDSTHITVTPNENLTLASAHYYILYTGLQVKSDGTVYTGGTSTSQFQVQNASGTSLLNYDTTNQQLSVRNLNDAAVTGAEMFTNSESFPATAGWTAISGTGASATATHTNGGGVTAIPANPALTISSGSVYKVVYTVSGMTTGSVNTQVGGVVGSTVTANSTQTDYITTTSTGNLQFVPSNNFDGTVTGVSVMPMSSQTPSLVVKDSTGAAAVELRASTSANGNLGIGVNALSVASGASSTSGEFDTAVGANALQSDTSGYQNTALGYNALFGSTTGRSDTAIGFDAFMNNLTGIASVAVGASALRNSISNSDNTAVGTNSLRAITTGGNDTAIGTAAGYQDGQQTDFNSYNNMNFSTILGDYAQATCSNCVILGGQGLNAASVGIGTPNPTNFVSAQPLEYNTGTVATTSGSGAVVGTGTTFISAMVGSEIYIASNSQSTATYKGTISAFTDATHITVAPNENLTLASAHFYILYTGFQVKSDGTVYTGGTSTSQFQVQNAAGTSLLNYDTTNQQLSVRNLNDAAVAGAEMFTNSESFPATAGWTAISGTGASATATHTNGGGTTALSPTPALSVTAGTVYKVVYTVSGMTGGNVNSNIGGISGVGVSSNSTQTDYITASTNGPLQIIPTNTFDGTVTGVSVMPMSNQTPSLVVKDSTGATAAELRVSTNANGNLALGINALPIASGFSNTSGTFNVALGESALQKDTSGYQNNALGYQALINNTTGFGNTAIGTQALLATTTGNFDVAVGGATLSNNIGGTHNTAIGYATLESMTNGSNNSAVGFIAGTHGVQTDFKTLQTIGNATMLGYASQAACSNCVILGGQGTEATSYGFGTPNPTNFLSAEPLQYNTGTVTTNSTTAVVGTGTTFTAAMVGSEIDIASNTSLTATYKGTITAFTDATDITVSPAVSFSLAGAHYYILYTGFQVKSDGTVYTGGGSASQFSVQNSAGTSIVNVDTTNQQLSVRNLNDAAVAGAEMFTGSESFSTPVAGWTSISGTGAGATATHTSGGGTTVETANPALTVTSGAVYKVVYTVSGMTGGSVNAQIGGVLGATVTTNTTQTDYITTTGTGNLQFVPSNNFDGTVTSVSVMLMSNQTPSLVVKDSTGATAAELRVSTVANGNLAFGINALQLASGISTSVGDRNTAFGTSSLQNNTSGYQNTALGYQALQADNTGNRNVAVGDTVLSANTSGVLNTAVGFQALHSNTSGAQNVAVGSFDLIGNSTGGHNSAFGYEALDNNATGSGNTGVGYRAGTQGTTQLDFETLSTISNSTLIGQGAQASCSSCLILGGQGADATTTVGIGTPNPTNFLSAEPLQYNTGTVAITSGSGAVVGTGTTFTAAMVGSEIYIASNSTTTATYKGTVTAYTDATDITVSPNETQTLASAHYYILYTGLQVSSTGNVGIGSLNPDQQFQLANGSTKLDMCTTACDPNTGAWIRNDGSNMVVSTNQGDLQVGYNPNGHNVSTRIYVGTTEEMRVDQATGNVGIGVTSPTLGKLQVASSGNTPEIYVDESGNTNAPGIVFATSPQDIGYKTGDNLQFGTWDGVSTWSEKMRLDSNGQLGLGNTPGFKLDVSSDNTTRGIRIQQNAGNNLGPDLILDNTNNAGGRRYEISSTGSGNGPGAGFLEVFDNSAGRTDMVIDANGNVGIGDSGPANKLKVVGSLCVSSATGACAGSTSGTIYATNTTVQAADLAENYISSQSLEPGDVIAPAADGNSMAIIKSSSANQSEVIGVISTKPGVTLNSDAMTDAAHPNLYPVALSGRVPVKVSTGNGSIVVGDKLASSAIPGVAMKAAPGDPTIGTALENYANPDTSAIGKITAFINLSGGGSDMQTAQVGLSGTVTTSTLFKNTTDSTAAFTIQSADGTDLLSADTAHMKLTVTALVINTTLTVNGHIITGGSVPTIAADAAACISPAVSVAGNDTAGTVTVTTGTGCSNSGSLATITFNSAYAVPPQVVLSAANAPASLLPVYNTTTTTTYTISTPHTPVDATTYTYRYHTLQ